MVRVEVKLITPSLAKEWLDLNTDNYRKVNKVTVQRYTNEMKAGRWELNGETIVFDEDGLLKNGQHRLFAVIAADTPIESVVVFGISRDVTTYDDGKIRSMNERGLARGIQTNTSICGAGNLIVSRLWNSRAQSGKNLVLDYIEEHYSNFKKASLFCNRGSSNAPMKKAPCVAAVFCALELAYMPEKDLEVFCEMVNSNVPKDGYLSYAANVLRNTLTQNGLAKNGHTLSKAAGGSTLQEVTFDVTWQALTAFKEGRKVQRNFKPNGKGVEAIDRVLKMHEQAKMAEVV